MLRAVVRRGCGVSPNLLPVGSRYEAFGDCTSSSLSVNEVVSSRGTGLASVDRCSENGVLGFGLGSFGRPSSSRSSWERLTHFPLERSNAVLPGSHSAPRQLSHVRGFIQLKTNLEVADNSGAKRVQCIKVMKGSNAAKIGDIIMASVKDAQPRGKVKKGEVVTCVVVRAATQKLRRDGSEIKFDKNAVVLVNKQGEPIGTRIFGPVPHELRRRKLVKILTLADYVA